MVPSVPSRVVTTGHARPAQCLIDTAALNAAALTVVGTLVRPAAEVVERFAFRANEPWLVGTFSALARIIREGSIC